MAQDDLESIYGEFTESEHAKSQLLAQIQNAAELWPEFLAMFKGMIQQAIDDGWEEIAARALVLASITGATNLNVLANLRAAEDEDSTE